MLASSGEITAPCGVPTGDDVLVTPSIGKYGRTKKPAEDEQTMAGLIRWSMQGIRRVATRLALNRMEPARIIAWSCWRRAHQAEARRAHLLKNRQL